MIKDEIRKDILDLASKAEDDLKEIFANVDKTCMINSNRVLSAFIENNVSYSDFAERNGYGNYDAGRDKLEAIFAYTLGSKTTNYEWNKCAIFSFFWTFKTW